MTILSILSILKTNFPTFEWTVPVDLQFGILTTNQAFKEAGRITKETGQKANPNQIVHTLALQISRVIETNKLPLQLSVVGCYINFDLDFNTQIDFHNWGILNQSDRKILLEYVGVNVAKPMHVGHLRNANLGESLRRILKLKYTNMVTDHHWGDWGVQFGVLLWAWKIFEKSQVLSVTINEVEEDLHMADFETTPIDVLVKLYVWGSAQEGAVEHWKDLVREEHLKLEQGDLSNRSLWKSFVEKSKIELRKDLAMLHVPAFDYEQGESYYEPMMTDLIEFMDRYCFWKTEDKGRYIDLEDLIELWPTMPVELSVKIKNFGRCYLIQTKNGYTTYPFRDVAARLDWAKNIQAETCITLTDHTQKHNFDQAFAIISYLASTPEFIQKYGEDVAQRLDWHNLVHIQYGFLTLPAGKMSTRKGNFLTARNLINQIVGESQKTLFAKSPELETNELDHRSQVVAIAALKWYDLARDSLTELVLDIPKVLSFEGNTGVYQLYTVARLVSIIKKFPSVDFSTINEYTLINDSEKLILKKVLLLPKILESVCESYKPHLLCSHLFELATSMNSWYVGHSVMAESNAERQKEMLSLCELVRAQLVFGLDLLGIETLDSL
jgi:arginyl-tRNA synthetase